jgi:hypothetical protein
VKNLSSWRSVRVLELAFERDLRSRHSLWLHGWCIGLLVLGVMWGAAYLQSTLGEQSLALRYLFTLGAGYLAYLGVLRLWAAALLRTGTRSGDFSIDFPSGGSGGSNISIDAPGITAGGGGDFAGGGASADFGGSADVMEGLGNVAAGSAELAAASGEGAVVVVPVVAIFLIAVAIIFGFGALMFLYFGWDVLLAVAIEISFGYLSGRTAARIAREGWLSAAVRLTWKPLLAAVVCAVLLGATIDLFLPSARTLPQAVKLIRLHLRGAS